ncbi:MAG: NAD-dependent epimerase/dehydratase family protein [Ignavibacteria bacterium]
MAESRKKYRDKVLVTGAAGFIGYHLVERLVNEEYNVVGLDNINDYYDVNLKYARLLEKGIEKKNITENRIIKSNKYDNYRFTKIDISGKKALFKLFENEEFNYVVNLAAQPGVRYSITNPDVYVQSNLVGFANILEACRHNGIEHLVYASTSSVYGLNTKMPLSTRDNADHPISLYAATKKANELMAHTYSYLYNLPTTGLRFFTVYGPWGRPDMAIFKFAKAIVNEEEIEVYNYGKMKRDFTYIDDIIEGVIKVMTRIPKRKKKTEKIYPSNSIAPYKIYNIGNSQPVELKYFIKVLEHSMRKKAKKKYLPLQAGDVLQTNADVIDLEKEIGFKPRISLEEGISKFISWYKGYYSVER